jgi:2-dehydropantoate 2-reductase
MRIVIFGAGAMACLFGAQLSAVAQVALVDPWTEAIDEIRKCGILVEGSPDSGRITVEAHYLGERCEPADLLLVLVKSWQTQQVAPHISDCLKAEGVAVSFQNGLGNVELLGERVFPGSTSEGATLVGLGHIRSCGRGPTYAVAPEWAVDLMRKAGFECYRCSRDQAESLLWSKLTVSCGINAITALLSITNGEILMSREASDIMIRAAEESAAVARAGEIDLPFSDAGAHAREVALKTAANKSSMLQDILRGAPTECDAINGAVVREGKRLNVPTPVNEILWRLVSAAVQYKRSDC